MKSFMKSRIVKKTHWAVVAIQNDAAHPFSALLLWAGMEPMPSATPPPDPSGLFGEIDAGLEAGASDWQFKGGEPCHLRVHGKMIRLGRPPLPPARVQALARAALGASDPVPADCDASFEYRGECFRLHSYSAGGAFCLNLRHVSSNIRDLDTLGVPSAFREAALASPRGLILVTGSSGSGKSTTLAAAVDHLNRHQAELILTFEDPIEVRHRNQRGLVRQMEKGRDFTGFAQAQRGAQRSYPDVILVGEMRDHETMSAALTAAETGHLVLGTLHCATARDAVSRIIDSYPPERSGEVRTQLAKSLVAVLAQQLIPSLDGRRVGAFELMLATAGVRNLIGDPSGKHSLLANEIATGGAHGMVAMDQSLADLCRRRLIDSAQALKFAVNGAVLESLIKQRSSACRA
jgi:twitching motility protein PilT